jgi:DNA repair protein RecN (Recombination protein N)
MLQRLSVRNYAIIADLEVHFGEGLNIITGETGAGKSILVGALGLVLGDRADTSVLTDPGQKAFVEAVFRAAEGGLANALLQQWDIDAEAEIVLRREISAAGKSRAFINDTPVNLGQLEQLASCLVDLHLQFDTLDVGHSDFQCAVLDAMASQRPLLERYRQSYSEMIALRKKLQVLEQHRAAAIREQDYRQFLLDELAELNWQPGEWDALQEEHGMLSHAEQVRDSVGRVLEGLSEGETPMLRFLRSSAQQLQAQAAFHPQLPELAERLQSAYVELEDIAAELQRMSGKVSLDPARLDAVNERMAAAQRLVRKHGVQDADGLIGIRESLENALQDFMNRDDEIRKAQQALAKAEVNARDLAGQLHDNRTRQVKPLEKQVAAILHRIGMPNATLEVSIEEGTLREQGADQVSFLFDANRSGHPEPLHKVASGGELSRLMLAVKSLVAGSLSMPTLIFDEIDSGISGEAARQVGMLMKDLGKRHQVISITHQPQIAARADHHFFVFKQDVEGRVRTQVRLLDADGHVEAIARMMGGEKPSRLLMENAREMVAESANGS